MTDLHTAAREVIALLNEHGFESYPQVHALSQALEQPAPVTAGSLESLILSMQESSWEGVIQLSDALKNINDFAAEQPSQQEPVGHLRMGPKQDFVTTGAAGDLEINVWHPLYTRPQARDCKECPCSKQN